MVEENNENFDMKGIKDQAVKFFENIEKFVNRNEEGNWVVKMPHGVEDYVVRDLTTREEQKAKKLAGGDIDAEQMCIIRSIVHPKGITTEKWLELPARITKRLEYVKRYIDGDLDFFF